MNLQWTTTELKTALQCKTNIPVDLQRLIFNGKQLDDFAQLPAAGVRKDSTIHLVLRLMGGMKSSGSRCQPTGDTYEATSSTTVRINPIPFLHNNPKMWFRKLEGAFELHDLQNPRKRFLLAFQSLPDEVIAEVPEEMESYEELKQLVLSLNEKSAQEKIQEALGDCSLDGRRPSSFIRHMKTKLQEIGVIPNEELLKTRLQEAMPEEAKLNLSGHSHLALEDFIKVADSLHYMMDRMGAKCKINAVSSDNNRQSNRYKNTQASNHNFSNQSAATRGNVGHEPYKAGQLQKICRAHIYYADNARSCKPWCRWPGKKPNLIVPSSRNSSPVNSRSSSPDRQGN